MKKIWLYLIMLFGVFTLSTSALFVKALQAPTAVIAFYRLVFSSLILLPVFFSKKQYRQELNRLCVKDVFLACIAGAFLATHYLLWFESLRYTSVASSVVIVTMQPFFSLLGGIILFKERYSLKCVLGVFISIIGSLVIGFSDFQIGGRALYGDILAFASAGLITVYFFIGQHLRKKISVIPYSLTGYISSSFILMFYVLIKKEAFFNYLPKTWFLFIGIALISTIFGQMVLNFLLKWLSTAVISMGILTEPIFASILSIFILDESIRVKQLLGMLVIILGLIVFIKNVNEKEPVS